MFEPAPAGEARRRRSAPRPQVELVREQLRRSPYALLFIDSVIAWLLIASGSSPWIIAWVLCSAAIQFARVHVFRRIRLDEPDRVAGELRAIDFWFLANGLTRIWPICVAFASNSGQADYLITIIMVGLAAGGVGTAAGMLRAYLWWAMPVALALMVGWISRGTFEGYSTAALLVVMFALLSSNVRNFGHTLAQLREQILRASDERDRAEAERRRADEERQRAEIAVLAKSRFFAAASHDLRQPLGVLRWYGDAVCVHAERLGHEALKTIGEGIGRALAHAEPLVSKYLDIAKIEAGALELNLRPLQLAQMFEQVHDAFAHEAESGAVSLRILLDAKAEQLQVVSDAGLLRSILDNLVGNAFKFTAAGEVVLRAGLMDVTGVTDGPAGRAGRLVRIAVQDTGVGIPPAEQERVFEDFYQLGNPDRSRSRGLGLGLAIVRRQAALLGTAVRLRSVAGVGSTFEFDLPAAEPSHLADEHTVPGMRAIATPGLRLLVVDDEPEVRTALRLMLEAVDWQVSTASGLGEAMAALQSGFRPDALVVDHRLHGELSGAELIEELRRAGCHAPALIVTGDTSPEQLATLGATGLPVLHKPVQGERLVAAIVNAIERATERGDQDEKRRPVVVEKRGGTGPSPGGREKAAEL